ncbi:hypothetical protein ACI8OL_004717 [Salmonella enterica]
MKSILKFRLFYLALVMAPVIFIFIISIDVKNTDIFIFIITEVLLIFGLVSSMYATENLLRVRFYKEKSEIDKTLEMIAICIRTTIIVLFPVIILRFILLPYFSV